MDELLEWADRVDEEAGRQIRYAVDPALSFDQSEPSARFAITLLTLSDLIRARVANA